jgi:hypothetical protein
MGYGMTAVGHAVAHRGGQSHDGGGDLPRDHGGAGTSDLPMAREALETARFLGRPVRLIADIGIAAGGCGCQASSRACSWCAASGRASRTARARSASAG